MAEPALPEDRRRAHYAWRKRVRRRLPELAARVFALRERSYSGGGFHWSMERQLGSVIARVNDYDNRLTWSGVIGDELAVEALFQDIAAAERSAAT